jgi:hypothetical protein
MTYLIPFISNTFDFFKKEFRSIAPDGRLC